LNKTISNSAQTYGLYDGEMIIGFIGILHFPHSNNKRIKRVTRLVILPDYQGIGLGTQFLTEIAKLYDDYDFTIITSAKNLIHSLNRNKNWHLKRYNITKGGKTTDRAMKKSLRKVKTASFQYVK